MTVVGARPNFMKAAPILSAVKAHNAKVLRDAPDGKGRYRTGVVGHVLVHTGQHYDEIMSDQFFADLNLPKPDVHLGVGSGSHAVQTAEIMKRFESVLLQEKPDVMIVVGDVNSTIACAMVASKIPLKSGDDRPLIAHVEAGLRSFDRTMPEESNRILTDHLSDLLFVTEESGLKNLRKEGISQDKIHFVGNTMIDSLLTYKDKADTSTVLDRLGLYQSGTENGPAGSVTRYALLTLHRPSNVDSRETFLNILEGLGGLTADCRVIFPAHPRTRKQIREFEIERYFNFNHHGHVSAETGVGGNFGRIHLTAPLGYLDFLCLMKNAALVVTDSGGIQEETTCLGVPCVTVRENTERPVTVRKGTNVIAGVETGRIRRAVRRQIKGKVQNRKPEKWDGKTGTRILKVLQKEFRKRRGFQS